MTHEAVRQLASQLRDAILAFEKTAPKHCPPGCSCPLSMALRSGRMLVAAVDGFDQGELVPGGLPNAAVPPMVQVSTVVPREIAEYLGVPVVPPVRLGVGGSVDLWLVQNGDGVTYQHKSSTLEGARVELLQLMLSRGMRLVVREVMAEFGVEPTR